MSNFVSTDFQKENLRNIYRQYRNKIIKENQMHKFSKIGKMACLFYKFNYGKVKLM